MTIVYSCEIQRYTGIGTENTRITDCKLSPHKNHLMYIHTNITNKYEQYLNSELLPLLWRPVQRADGPHPLRGHKADYRLQHRAHCSRKGQKITLPVPLTITHDRKVELTDVGKKTILCHTSTYIFYLPKPVATSPRGMLKYSSKSWCPLQSVHFSVRLCEKKYIKLLSQRSNQNFN